MADAVTVTLGGMGVRARALVDSGRFASMSEVVREGIKALDRQEEMLDLILKAKIAEALADSRPRIPLNEAMALVKASMPDDV